MSGPSSSSYAQPLILPPPVKEKLEPILNMVKRRGGWVLDTEYVIVKFNIRPKPDKTLRLCVVSHYGLRKSPSWGDVYLSTYSQKIFSTVFSEPKVVAENVKLFSMLEVNDEYFVVDGVSRSLLEFEEGVVEIEGARVISKPAEEELAQAENIILNTLNWKPTKFAPIRSFLILLSNLDLLREQPHSASSASELNSIIARIEQLRSSFNTLSVPQRKSAVQEAFRNVRIRVRAEAKMKTVYGYTTGVYVVLSAFSPELIDTRDEIPKIYMQEVKILWEWQEGLDHAEEEEEVSVPEALPFIIRAGYKVVKRSGKTKARGSQTWYLVPQQGHKEELVFEDEDAKLVVIVENARLLKSEETQLYSVVAREISERYDIRVTWEEAMFLDILAQRLAQRVVDTTQLSQPQLQPQQTQPQPAKPQQQLIAPQSAVVVKGFLVVSRLPSKALLDAHLPEVFKGIQVGQKIIRLVTGYFYNKLGTLSRKFYNQILRDHAINIGIGYLVPEHKVPAFLREVQRLRKEYEEFEKQLKEFLLEGKIPPLPKRAKVDPQYLKVIREYLKQHGAEEAVRTKIESLSITSRVKIQLIPLFIDMSLLEEYIDENVRREVEGHIKSVQQEIAREIETQLRQKLREFMKKLQEFAKGKVTQKMVEKAKKELEDIEKTAKDFGVSIPEIEVVKDVLEEQELEKIGQRILELSASGRVKALLESM